MEGDPLPDNWRWTTVGEVADPQGRAIVSGPFGSNIGSRFFVDRGVPVIRGNNLTMDMTRFVDDGFVFVTEDKADELGNCDAVSDDLVFTAAGSLGQVGLIPKGATYPRYIISNKQLRVRVDKSIVDPLFVFYWFASNEMVEYIQQRNTGSSVPLINLSVLRSLPLPLPPLPEQRAIAYILGTLDGKIELNRRMNATLEAMAQALFRSWFFNFDPVRAKAEGRQPAGMDAATAALFPDEFEESELGEIPKGWEIAELRDRTTNIQYGFTQSASSEEVGPKFLRITDIQGGRVDWASVPYCEINEENRIKYQVKPGDILIARTGASTGENVHIIDAPDAVFASYLVRLQYEYPSFARVVGEFLRTDAYFDHVRSLIGGSAQPNASAQALASATFVFPPIEVADAFFDSVRSYDKLKMQFEWQSSILSKLRDILLPRLLSGELSVTPPVTQIGDA